MHAQCRHDKQSHFPSTGESVDSDSGFEKLVGVLKVVDTMLSCHCSIDVLLVVMRMVADQEFAFC